MSISSLQDLFVHPLGDVYFAENLIVKQPPTLIAPLRGPAQSQGGLK